MLFTIASVGAVTRAFPETLDITSRKLRDYSETYTPSGTPKATKGSIASEWEVLQNDSVIIRRSVANAFGPFAHRSSSLSTRSKQSSMIRRRTADVSLLGAKTLRTTL